MFGLGRLEFVVRLGYDGVGRRREVRMREEQCYIVSADTALAGREEANGVKWYP
jgi:hypothetical protein